MLMQTVETPRPELLDDARESADEWIVIVYDNDHNTFDQVTMILQKATGCTLEEAELETWEVHHLGRSIVHHADEVECTRVAGVIGTIGIQVEARKL
jgi:ATP-dependent Clp protease adapter protein ClpS